MWRWSWYSAEKGLDFNGYALRLPAGLVLIDPAYADEPVWAELERLGKPVKILLTNKDHERASDELRRRFGVPVAIHFEEAPLLQVPPEETFREGETLLGALETVRFHGLKSPAECAFLWKERRILIIGDLLTGLPGPSLGVVKKHLGNPKVGEAAERLKDLPFDHLLVGDGAPVVGRAPEVLKAYLAALTR